MRTAPHILILASLFAFGACSPAADAPTPKSADAPSKAAATDSTSSPSPSSSAPASSATSKPQPANENARLDLWFAAQYKASTRAYPQPRLVSMSVKMSGMTIAALSDWNSSTKAAKRWRKCASVLTSRNSIRTISYHTVCSKKTLRIVSQAGSGGIIIILIPKCAARIHRSQPS